MTAPNLEARDVQVTQAAREAAAYCHYEYTRGSLSWMHAKSEAERICSGEWDRNTLVQAFARFEHATTEALRAEIEALREALSGLARLLLPIEMQLAQAKAADEAIADDAVLFSFVGCGASDHVTVGEYRAAISNARNALKMTEQAPGVEEG